MIAGLGPVAVGGGLLGVAVVAWIAGKAAGAALRVGAVAALLLAVLALVL